MKKEKVSIFTILGTEFHLIPIHGKITQRKPIARKNQKPMLMSSSQLLMLWRLLMYIKNILKNIK